MVRADGIRATQANLVANQNRTVVTRAERRCGTDFPVSFAIPVKWNRHGIGFYCERPGIFTRHHLAEYSAGLDSRNWSGLARYRGHEPEHSEWHGPHPGRLARQPRFGHHSTRGRSGRVRSPATTGRKSLSLPWQITRLILLRIKR